MSVMARPASVAGEAADEIARDYRITPEDVQASLLYAAELAKERIVHLAATG